MKDIFLHIGLPKTGTTALQKTFSTLHDQGQLLYLRDEADGAVQSRDFSSLVYNGLGERTTRETLLAHIKQTRFSTVVLSDELLSRHGQVNAKKLTSLLDDIAEYGHIHLLMVVRPFIAWVESAINQSVKTGNFDFINFNASTCRAINNYPICYLDTYRFYESVASACGSAVDLSVFEYDHSIVEKVLDFMGQSQHELNLPKHNQSPDAFKSLLRFLRQHEHPETMIPTWESGRFLSPEHCQQLADANRPWLREFSQATGISLSFLDDSRQMSQREGQTGYVSHMQICLATALQTGKKDPSARVSGAVRMSPEKPSGTSRLDNNPADRPEHTFNSQQRSDPAIKDPENNDPVNIDYAINKETSSSSGIQSLLRDIRQGFNHWPVWRAFAWEQVIQRYRRSLLGIGWIAVSFLIFVFAITTIFRDFNALGGTDFLLYVSVGLAAYQFISGAITDGCGVFISSRPWILGTALPYSVYVYKSIYSSLLPLGMHCLVILCLLVAVDYPVTESYWLLLPALILFVLNATWLHFLLGTLSARYRDIQHLIAAVTRLLFFATPVLWVYDESSPGRQLIADLNPVTHFVQIFRAPVLGQTGFDKHWLIVLAITAGGWLVTLVVAGTLRRRVAIWI